MNTYRAGQRVRVEWADGSAVEGVVVTGLGTPWVDVPAVGGRVFLTDNVYAVTVLSEPRPDEPQGLGAVVEAGYKLYGRQRWVSNRFGDNPGNRWTSIPYWGFLDWNVLIDPVVLSEGWTP